MDGVHEPERILRLAFLALTTAVHGTLLRARHISGRRPERHAPGAPPLGTEREEPEMPTAQIDRSHLTRLDVQHTQPRVTLLRRPGDPEDQRDVQRGPN
ncbi:hypothetical protein CH293_00950 [Rhodococcus sp. 14-2470-1b]|nr:hypothetical protein CH301_00950 [Rhodococcus sp. 15-1189-1-1a]OZF22902.1 hypothetical protein CH299_00950 [Rhodococcus sp. 14-2686-1-2]OZF58702.1 hypothetical protein CH293_00950 [Rhodococcus sp. 14-2470-1b]